MAKVNCDKCGAECDGGMDSTGYGTVRLADGTEARHCFACCADGDREAMIRDGAATLYLTRDDKGYKVGNWPGSLTFKASNVRHGKHFCFGRRVQRTDADFTGPDGFVWHAVSRGDMDLCRVKRTRKVA